MGFGFKVSLSLAAALLVVDPARAQDAPPADDSSDDWSSRGEVALESRAFDDDDNALTEDQALGVLGRLELRHQHGRFEQKARVFGRMDHFDEKRSVFVAEEAWAQMSGERFRLRIGMDVVNWTATEAFHPADVINARNLDSDLENLEKLGEPMAMLMVKPFSGTAVSVFALPYYSEPIFTSPNSRLHFAPGVDLRGRRRVIDRDGAVADGNWGPQAAIQIRQVIGSADLGLHLIEHVDRLQPVAVREGLVPGLMFQTVRQIGGTYQHVLGSIIVKVEGAYRDFVPLDAAAGARFVALERNVDLRRDRDHGTVAIGFEYGLPHESGPESTLLLEGQFVLVDDEALRRSLSPFQRDALLGYRLALNDESSKELMLGALFDLEIGDEYMVTASYQQRIGETWTVKAGLRLFQADDSSDGGVARFQKSDHIRLTLTRHF